MTSVDFRNATYEGLRGQLEGLRRQVYEAWVAHGPGTTRAIAEKSGIDLLTFRPRSTELLDLGLIAVQEPRAAEPGTRNPHEGVYAATPQADWDLWREQQISPQMHLL